MPLVAALSVALVAPVLLVEMILTEVQFACQRSMQVYEPEVRPVYNGLLDLGKLEELSLRVMVVSLSG